jgi:hypothetical protein
MDSKAHSQDELIMHSEEYWKKLKGEYGLLEDPITYLGHTFEHAAVLLAVMFDTGSIISGSRALEFIVQKSVHEGSDWDFYVPAFKDAIVDMIEVLKICGVEWKARSEKVKNDGKTKVPGTVLNGLKTWSTEDDRESLLGEEINKYMKTYNPKTLLQLEREKEGDAATRQAYDWFLPSFGIMEGTIQNTKCKNIKVQLIVASSATWDQSIFKLISMFYASHVQCIIGGWYACHMYYKKAKAKESYKWKLNDNQNEEKVNAAIQKYEEREYIFISPQPHTIMRSLYDEESMFIDYSGMYSKILGEEIGSKYDRHIRERKYQLMKITWKEEHGKLIPNIPDRNLLIRNYGIFAMDAARKDAEDMLYQRLANDMAIKRNAEFVSSIHKTSLEWGVSELAKSAISKWKFKTPTPWSFSL